MPGIAGIVSLAPSDECERAVRTMAASMMHDASYASGTVFARELGVYACWVAHAGSFAARKCAITHSSGATLLVAGEWFAQQRAGAPERDKADGVAMERLSLGHAEAAGPSAVASLNGLFAGLLIDPAQRQAMLFNDRYGSERIYYFRKDGRTFFASEAKALLSVLAELRAFDERGVAQFLKYGSTFDGCSLFRNVRVLPGGSAWLFNADGSQTRTSYFEPSEWERQPALEEEAFGTEFNETMKRALPRYLSSESRLGISLTGGLDTRMIMACMPREAVHPICYTYAGLSGETLDARLGARVARECGFEHRILRIGRDFLSDFGYYVDRTVFVTDACAGALTAHEIYLTRLARQLAPVRLTGNYGSEVLRSMSTLKPIGLDAALLDPELRRSVDCAPDATKRDMHPLTRAAFHEIPAHLFGTLAAARSELTFRTPYLDNDVVALAYRAPARARHSSKAAFQLINRNHRALGTIPTDRGLNCGPPDPWSIARRLFCAATFKLDYLQTEGLPTSLCRLDPLFGVLAKANLLGLHKFLPYRTWFARELVSYTKDVLADSRGNGLPFWNAAFLASMLTEHTRGYKNRLRDIHAVLTLEAAQRLLVRGWSMSNRLS